MVIAPQRVRIRPQALALFAELEHAPDQRGRDFEDKAHELARLLDLVPEWWSGCSVLDRSDGPVHASPQYLEHRDWRTTRAVRQQLQAALEAQDKRSR
jgi:hypothetical protein